MQKIKTTFNLNKFLSNYDLSYKYLVKTKNEIPLLKKIKIILNLNNIISNEKSKKMISSSQKFRIAYFFLFSFFLLLPQVNAKSLTTLKESSQKDIENLYNISISITKTDYINSFNFFFFIDLWNKLNKLNIKFLFNNSNSLIKQNNFQLTLKIPFLIFNTLDFFYDLGSNQINQDESYMFFLFNFKNIDYNKKNESIKNLPLFWKIK